jgi:hypothetical protein
MNSEQILAGRLVQSKISDFTFACTDRNIAVPRLGYLVCASLEPNLLLYAVITNITWPGDELVNQLARSSQVEKAIVSDNRFQRGSGPMIQATNVGFRDAKIHHTLPSQAAYSLTEIYLCSPQEIVAFTSASLAYLRLLLLAAESTPIADLVAAHFQECFSAHCTQGDPRWIKQAVTRLASLLQTDYVTVVNIFEAIAQRIPGESFATYPNGKTNDE